MAAANLTQAAAQAGENVQLVSNTGGAALLKTRLESWIVALKGNLNPELATERTVLNWIPRGRQIAAEIDTSLTAIQSQGVADQVTMFVYQSCEAAAEALLSGRISAAAGVALLAAYNLTWP